MAERRTDHDSADMKAHGAHGRGGGKEHDKRVDEANVEPDFSRDSDGLRGDDGVGDQASGGSVIDKRSP